MSSSTSLGVTWCYSMLLPHFGVDVDASRVTICDSAEFTRGVGWLGVFVSDPKKMLRPV